MKSIHHILKCLARAGVAVLLFQTVVYARAELTPHPCTIITLDNGLRVVFMEKHDTPVVALRAYVHVGSVYEREFVGCGISHYAEHLVSGGTTHTRPEEESAVLMKELGDEVNAYTTYDHTCYHITTTRAHWRTATELIADWLANCAFVPEQVAREKEVILQEIRMDEEEPDNILWKLTQSTAYQCSPLRVPIIGYESNFKRLTRENLVEFYRKQYCANNMVLAVVGDIRLNELQGILEATFGQISRRPEIGRVIPTEQKRAFSRTEFKRSGVNQALVELSFPSIRLNDPDLYALDLLAEILGAGESSLLVRKIKHEKKLVYSIATSSWTPHYERGLFSVSMTCHETNVAAAVDAVCRELAQLAVTPVEAEDLSRARQKSLVAYYLNRQTAAGLAEELGENVLSMDDPQFGVRYAEGLQQATAADIQRAAAAYLNTNTMICTGLLPQKPGVDEQQKERDDVSGERQKFTVERLANGIRVAYQQNDAVPLAAFCLYLPAGQECETEQTCGTSDFLAQMLTRGTQARTAEQIATETDKRGASLSYRSTRSAIAGTAECLAEDAQEVFALLADTALNPAFPDEELEKQRGLSLAAIKAQYDSWSYEGYVNFYSLFFRGHPYALPPLGDTNVIEHLTREQLQAFHASSIQPSNIVIAAAGAIQPEELLAWCRTYFGPARPRGIPLARPARFTPHVDNRMHTHASDREQATVVLGFRGPALSNPERYAVELADGFLGGMSGRLFQDLRVKNDLVYVSGSFPFIQESVGGVIALAQCEPRNARRVLGIMTNAYAEMRTALMSEAQLAAAGNSLLIPKMLESETLAGRVTEAAKWEYFGESANYGGVFAEKLTGVTAGDIRNAARTYFTDWTCMATTPNDVLYRTRTFLQAYPKARAQDLYKMICQATCGPGHLGTDKETITANLEKEWNLIAPKDGPLWLPVALENDWAWFNLEAWKFRKGNIDAVAETLWRSVQASREDSEARARNWQTVVEAIIRGDIKFSDPDLQKFTARIQKENYPSEGHTQEFIDEYHPAYRVLSRHIWEMVTGDGSNGVMEKL